MKQSLLKTRIVMLALLLSLSCGVFAASLAKWAFPSVSTPILYPKEYKALPIVLAAEETRDWRFSFLDLRKPGVAGATCFSGQATKQAQEIPPLRINGKYVKFKSICMGQVGSIQPQTEVGQQYLNKLALSGEKITLEFNDIQKVTFPASDVAEMKQRISDTNNAM